MTVNIASRTCTGNVHCKGKCGDNLGSGRSREHSLVIVQSRKSRLLGGYASLLFVLQLCGGPELCRSTYSRLRL